MASAHAVLNVIEEEQLRQRSQRLGQHLVEVLQQAHKTSPAITDIRAQESMVAVEFNDPAFGGDYLSAATQSAGRRVAAAELWGKRHRDPLPVPANYS